MRVLLGELPIHIARRGHQVLLAHRCLRLLGQAWLHLHLSRSNLMLHYGLSVLALWSCSFLLSNRWQILLNTHFARTEARSQVAIAAITLSSSTYATNARLNLVLKDTGLFEHLRSGRPITRGCNGVQVTSANGWGPLPYLHLLVLACCGAPLRRCFCSCRTSVVEITLVLWGWVVCLHRSWPLFLSYLCKIGVKCFLQRLHQF